MAPKPQAAQLRELHVTPGQLELRQWHIFLGKAAQGAALILILGSYVALQWAAHFVGLRPLEGQILVVGWFAVAMSFIVPLAIEGGMAVIGATLTTVDTGTRLDEVTGQIRKVRKVWLVLIFAFLMALAQAANIGHAVVAVHEALGGPEGQSLPPGLPIWVIYTFACAFAALFPLGGTFMVYVAGFLRKHGTGAKWITEETEKVHVEVGPGAIPALARPQPRTNAEPGPRTEPAMAAAVADAATRDTPAPANVRQIANDERTAVFEEYRRRVKADPKDRMEGGEIAERLKIHPGRARSLRKEWDDKIAELALAGGDRAELDLPQARDDERSHAAS